MLLHVIAVSETCSLYMSIFSCNSIVDGSVPLKAVTLSWVSWAVLCLFQLTSLDALLWQDCTYMSDGVIASMWQHARNWQSLHCHSYKQHCDEKFSTALMWDAVCTCVYIQCSNRHLHCSPWCTVNTVPLLWADRLSKAFRKYQCAVIDRTSRTP